MKKRKIKPIGSITQERNACIRAFRKYPKAKWAWCCHHLRLHETLSTNSDQIYGHGTDWMGRILYIDRCKPTDEKAIRFRNFRPVIGRAGTHEAFNRQWPNNTWDGYCIFPWG